MDVEAMVSIEAAGFLHLRPRCMAMLRTSHVVVGFETGDLGLVILAEGGAMRLRKFATPEKESEQISQSARAKTNPLSRMLGLGNSASRRTASDGSDACEVDALAVLSIGQDDRRDDFVCTLERRGRIRIWKNPCIHASDPRFSLIFEQDLGYQLVRNSDHFMISSEIPNPSFAVILMSDEGERAPSMKCLIATLNEGSAVGFREIFEVRGPVDAPTGAFVIGAKSNFALCIGHCTGQLREVPIPISSNEMQDDTQERSRWLWSLNDEYENPLGVWGVIDRCLARPLDRIFAPFRFSERVIARSIRRPDLELTHRTALMGHVKKFLHSLMTGEAQKSMDDAVNRLVDRATRLTRTHDMEIVGIRKASEGSVFVSRGCGEFVFRPCSSRELSSLAQENLSSSLEYKGPVTNTLVGMSALQAIGVAISGTQPDPTTREALIASAGFACRSSDSYESRSLIGFAVDYVRERLVGDSVSLEDWVDEIVAALAPGSDLLICLREAGDFEALLDASQAVKNLLPCSASFSYGLCQLENWKKTRERTESGLANVVEEFMAKVSLEELLANKEDAMTLGELAHVSGDRTSWTPDYLAFWYRERLVRLLEAARAPYVAASVAFEALQWSPSQACFEMMRNVAFHRFLEVEELEQALSVILADPFEENAPEISQDDELVMSSALKDAMNLLVAAAAERDKLFWLSSASLPPAVMSLIAWSLKQRARTSSVVRKNERLKTAYEDLCVWHMARNDAFSVATFALEWAQRLLADESQCRSSPVAWLKDRCKALTWVSTALHCSPAVATRWICSREFRLDHGLGKNLDPSDDDAKELLAEGLSSVKLGSIILDLDQVNKILLLAQGQLHLVEKLLDEGRSAASIGSLDESDMALEWCIGGLCEMKLLEEALNLALMWSGEIPHMRFLDLIIRRATIDAHDDGHWDRVSQIVNQIEEFQEAHPSVCFPRNVYLKVAELALAHSAGVVHLPAWLVNLAAWGTAQGSSTTSGFQKGLGDPGAMASLFLRYGRTMDAADVLIEGFLSERQSEIREIFIPYLQIEQTLEKLGSSNAPSSQFRKRQLKALVEDHKKRYRPD
uniref:Uncharacterized protein n=1 Tax=Compsopogon caeruleus TaxID=31354 RepID=A0A7S1TBS1_9RHOD